MKKHLSVFMLMARSSILPALGLMLLMGAVQGVLFFLVLQADPAETLSTLVDESRILWAFRVCFLLVTALLCLTGCEFGAKTGYTLGRLSLSPQLVCLWQWAYNAAVFFLLWAAQLFVVLGLCALYLRLADPYQVNGQTVFLAFYRNDFLHSLLPLEDTVLWVRNAVLAVCLGACAARFPVRQRQGKPGLEIIVLALPTLFLFPCALGDFVNVMLTVILAVACAGISLSMTLGKETKHETA